MRPLVLIAALVFAVLISEAAENSEIQIHSKVRPIASSMIPTNETLTPSTKDFIHGILASGRMSPSLNCRLQVRSINQERKFSTGSKWVEYLEVELFTDHLGPRSLKYSFPVGTSLLGRRIVDSEQGPVEEIKLVAETPDSNWLLFQHDGTRLIWAEMGSVYSFAPCLIRNH